MGYDYKKLYEKQAEFYQKRPVAKRILLYANRFLPLLFFGVYFLVFLLIALQAKFEILRRIGFLCVPALALLVVSVLRQVIDKPRPYTVEGSGITPMIYKKNGMYKSFPSRHTASATVIATVLLPFYPLLGAFLLVLSFGVAYTRFATGVHYPSDILAGGGIGLLMGCSIFLF